MTVLGQNWGSVRVASSKYVSKTKGEGELVLPAAVEGEPEEEGEGGRKSNGAALWHVSVANAK
jgi:hypothetical protein